MDTTKEPLSHISLCFGYGGIDLGLHRIFGENLRLAAVCEIEAPAIENALSKMEAGLLPPAPIWTDLRSFPWETFVGCSMVSAGFPCQPFSHAGRREADNDPRHLFPAIIKGITRCRPSIVLLENVEGIISAKLTGDDWNDPAGTSVLLHVLRELERLDYIPTAGIFDAASEIDIYGNPAPHQRKRTFILAHSKESRLEGFSERFAESLEGGEREMHSGGVCTFNAWPSRPNQNQFLWEPPRVCNERSIVPRGEELAHTGSSGRREDRQQTELRADMLEQSPSDCGSANEGEGNEERQGTHLADNNCQRLSGQQEGRLHGRWEGESSEQSPQGDADRTFRNDSQRCDGQVGNTTEQGLQGGRGSGEVESQSGEEESGGHRPSPSTRHASVAVAGTELVNSDSTLGIDVLREQCGSTSHSQPCNPSDMGNPAMPRRSQREADLHRTQDAALTANQDGQDHEAECPVGGNALGGSYGMAMPGMPPISHQELAEIHSWMHRCVSRIDELRMAGNGVCPPTLETAFRTLFNRLLKQQQNQNQ